MVDLSRCSATLSMPPTPIPIAHIWKVPLIIPIFIFERLFCVCADSPCVVDDFKMLSLMFGQNRVSNSFDIADIEFLVGDWWWVGGRWVVD